MVETGRRGKGGEKMRVDDRRGGAAAGPGSLWHQRHEPPAGGWQPAEASGNLWQTRHGVNGGKTVKGYCAATEPFNIDYYRLYYYRPFNQDRIGHFSEIITGFIADPHRWGNAPACFRRQRIGFFGITPPSPMLTGEGCPCRTGLPRPQRRHLQRPVPWRRNARRDYVVPSCFPGGRPG